MSNGFKTILLFYIPLVVVLSFINYMVKTDDIAGSILFGLIGGACVLCVPILFKKLLNKNKRK
jgi:hypothetical protein